MILLDYWTQTLCSSYLWFPGEEPLYMQLSQNVLYNSSIHQETGSTTLNSAFSTNFNPQCLAMERVVPIITARFVVTTSKVSFSSISIVVMHVHPRYQSPLFIILLTMMVSSVFLVSSVRSRVVSLIFVVLLTMMVSSIFLVSSVRRPMVS